MIIVLSLIYGLLLLVAAINLFLMPRPIVSAQKTHEISVLIPARNEEENLKRLLPRLVSEVGKVYVYDDHSSDSTAKVASELGATVIRGQDLPVGWTGKNHACYQLSKIASEDSPHEWWLFLDADTEVKPGFGGAISNLIERFGTRCPVITGFGKMEPGKALEPVYLFWVPFILLATIPFGLISKSRLGHARFTNGQFTIWKATKYAEIQPHEALKAEILEDIKIGRLLAKNRIPVETTNLSEVFSVHMYRSLKDAIQGMLKNSRDIAPNKFLSLVIGLLVIALALLSISYPLTILILVLSAGAVALTIRSFPWAFIFVPISMIAGGLTIVASSFSKKPRVWKERSY